MNNILDVELFKNQKQLDKDYFNYMGHCNRYFGTDVSPDGMFRRLYFATRYLEGTVNGYSVFTKIGINDEEYQKGTELFCSWLEDIIARLRINGF